MGMVLSLLCVLPARAAWTPVNGTENSYDLSLIHISEPTRPY